MSGVNVVSSPVVPALVASSASAGTAGGATAVHTLPTTGFGLTLMLVVMAVTFILVGVMLLWNPLGRNRRQPLYQVTVPGALEDVHQS